MILKEKKLISHFLMDLVFRILKGTIVLKELQKIRRLCSLFHKNHIFYDLNSN